MSNQDLNEILSPIPKTAMSITLPSRGVPYEKGHPLHESKGKIALSPMTLVEENQLFSVKSDMEQQKVIDTILKKCVHEKLDVNYLISADKLFLFMMLRAITYGADYIFDWKCTSCGHKNRKIVNIPNDFKIKMLSDEDIPPYETTLPQSGKKIKFRLATGYDEHFVLKHEKEIEEKRKSGVNVANTSAAYSLALKITHVDDIEIPSTHLNELVKFIVSLPIVDIRHLNRQMQYYTPGMDTEVNVKCAQCGETYDIDMPITINFFRPISDDDRRTSSDEIRTDVLSGDVLYRNSPDKPGRVDLVLEEDSRD